MTMKKNKNNEENRQKHSFGIQVAEVKNDYKITKSKNIIISRKIITSITLEG